MPLRLDRVYCLDVLKGLSLLKDDSIDLCVTSPPYNKGWWSKNRNMNNGLDFRKASKCRRIDYGVYDDKMPPEEYALWQSKVISEILRVLKPSGSLFYNHTDLKCNHKTIHPTWVYAFNVKQICIWNRKNTPILTPEYFYPTHEYLFWITNGGKVKFKKNEALFTKSIWDISPAIGNKHPRTFSRSPCSELRYGLH